MALGGPDEAGGDEDEHAEDHGEGVKLHEAHLQAAHHMTDRRGNTAYRIDEPIDDPAIDPVADRRNDAEGPDDEGVVDFVKVKLVARQAIGGEEGRDDERKG